MTKRWMTVTTQPQLAQAVIHWLMVYIRPMLENNNSSASSSPDLRSQHSPPPEVILYKVRQHGSEFMDITPVDKSVKPWKELPCVNAADLGEWTVRAGDIVTVHLHADADTGEYAKVSEIRRYDNNRYVVIYTWLYTREEVEAELQTDDGFMPKQSQRYLDRKWPSDACYEYMFSTNRTVSIWDTAICRAPKKITTKICDHSIYQTTPSKRRIWSVNNRGFKWMRQIIQLKATVQQA